MVIDEAYLLNPSASSKGGSDPYKASVIDTIVEQVQGTPGDDRAVILLGYRNEMEKLFADSNPGLARRFQMENAFQFEDYDDDALLRILLNRCSSDQIKISVETASLAIKKLAKARALPNFGNAGSVNNLLASAKINMQARQSKLRPSERKDVLLPEDFGVEETQRRIDPEELFAGLVCCDALVKKLEEYQNLIKACAAKGQDPKKYVEFNFVFAGSPGNDLVFLFLFCFFTPNLDAVIVIIYVNLKCSYLYYNNPQVLGKRRQRGEWVACSTCLDCSHATTSLRCPLQT